MLDDGMLDEIKQLKERNYNPELPALRSQGIAEFYAYLDGDMAFADAKQRMTTLHCQYAKRQMTWLRNSFTGDSLVGSADDQPLWDTLEKLFLA